MEKIIEDEFTTNIAGRIKNLDLPKSKALWPLFEIISNAIHAIEEKGNVKKGKINIQIDREGHDEALNELKDVSQYFIKSFIVSDNGIGFNDLNYKSFLTAESDYKVEKGAKGIGRFVCLKAFKIIEYKSSYRDTDNIIRNRQFSLKGYGKAINGEQNTLSQEQITGTEVILNTYNDEYKINCPKSIHEIGEKIVEHFFIYFLEDRCPLITIIDTNGAEVSPNNIFGKELLPNVIRKDFKVKTENFNITIFKVDKKQSGHKVYYCANCRSVTPENLSKYIPDLVNNVFLTGSDDLHFQIYITSDYLDKHVGNERTKFNFPDNEEDALYDFIVTYEDIKKQVTNEIEALLKVPLEELRLQKIESIKRHVEQYAPQFKYVLKHKSSDVSKLSANLSGEKLEVELFKLQQKIELETKILGDEVMNKNDFNSVEDYQKAYHNYVEQSNELGKANLVKYVIHRRAIIDLLEKFLGGDEDGKFQSERTIHELFFPIRKESDDVKYEQQNLWLIDERLTYHYYLASDKPMVDMPILDNIDNKDRPDLFIFNSSFAFVNEAAPFNSFIIVEFKKPERKDYNDQEVKNNPVDQVIDYIDTLRSGAAKDRTNKYIQISDKEKIPFYAYVICDFNPKLNKLLGSRNFNKTPDGLGYFYFHTQFNAYIEVISYQKLLKDAKNRNKILFEKLGITG
ncbi:ATP-binding protein [Spirosoma sp.]|uniref:ATP-binding protein n=1 Tax=Spirosoma sp. TaxID=1899569 RepID=UPI00261C52EB|nr:ATP-binding protein [Spirosoma sp.]MCX6212942.1 ATP-binding protein [Spirosoma sp.]